MSKNPSFGVFLNFEVFEKVPKKACLYVLPYWWAVLPNKCGGNFTSQSGLFCQLLHTTALFSQLCNRLTPFYYYIHDVKSCTATCSGFSLQRKAVGCCTALKIICIALYFPVLPKNFPWLFVPCTAIKLPWFSLTPFLGNQDNCHQIFNVIY